MKSYDIRSELQQRFQKMGSDGIVLNSCIAREWRERGRRKGKRRDLQRSVNRLHSIEQMKNNKRHSWTLKEHPRGWKLRVSSNGRDNYFHKRSRKAYQWKLQNKPIASTSSSSLSFLSFLSLSLLFLKSKVYEKFLENSTTSLTINWNSVEKLFQKLKNKYPRKILRNIEENLWDCPSW